MSKVGITSVKVNGVRINGIGSPSHSSPSKPSLPPHIKDALVGVWCTEGKSNDDSDRDIIKNKISGRGGDFNILNAAYKLGSGYGEYKEDFKDWSRHSNPPFITSNNIKVTDSNQINPAGYLVWKANKTNASFKVKVSGIPGTSYLRYTYLGLNETIESIYIEENDKEYYLPASGIYTSGHGFIVGSNVPREDWIGLIIEQIPDRQGAFATDGVNDLIVSQKTVSEMLEGSDEVTVVSMILNLDINKTTRTNFIGGMGINSDIWINNETKSYNKTGIYGYSRTNSNVKIINNILGDKSDYSTSTSIDSGVNKEFSVIGYRSTSGIVGSTSPSAYYWTMMFKSASITIDDIHQVIAHFNLDKRVVPTIYYDIKKQGLSNDTPDKDWYLKDFSGNGRDAKLYNFAKKLNSGVGLYAEDFTSWTAMNGAVKYHNKIVVVSPYPYPGNHNILMTKPITSSFKIKISGLQKDVPLEYDYTDENSKYISISVSNDGIYIIPKPKEGTGGRFFSSMNTSPNIVGLTIEQIPEHDGALVLDGVNDYAQYVGDLGLKDYTIAVDRAYGVFNQYQIPIIASKFKNGSESFIFEHSSDLNQINSYSFGAVTIVKREYALTRKVSYQTAYAYNGVSINKGISTLTGSGLTIGRYGEDYNYAAIRLYSLLLFPYSLSEFLLDRQLKRYKLGTLYPETK